MNLRQLDVYFEDILNQSKYQGDKKKMVNMFVTQTFQFALINLSHDYKNTNKKEVFTKLLKLKNSEEGRELLAQYFLDEEIEKAFGEALKTVLGTYTLSLPADTIANLRSKNCFRKTP